MQWKLIVLFAVFFCAANIQDARAQNSYDSLLQEADRGLEAPTPKRFTELLEQLRDDNQKTTLLQKQRPEIPSGLRGGDLSRPVEPGFETG